MQLGKPCVYPKQSNNHVYIPQCEEINQMERTDASAGSLHFYMYDVAKDYKSLYDIVTK